jgi:hypothetical protein
VQIVRRKAPAVAVQMIDPGLERHLRRPHLGLVRRQIAFSQHSCRMDSYRRCSTTHSQFRNTLRTVRSRLDSYSRRSTRQRRNQQRLRRLRKLRPDTQSLRRSLQRIVDLMHHYTVAEEKSRLVLTKTAGDMKLFLYDLDDLHQLDFVHNQQMVKEIERLRMRATTTDQQRESWKVRALMAEAELLEATAKASNSGGRQNVSDLRYASLKRYLAKRFHPDYAPGQGIEKIVRNEIFKEIWNEIERLDQGASTGRFATG